MKDKSALERELSEANDDYASAMAHIKANNESLLIEAAASTFNAKSHVETQMQHFAALNSADERRYHLHRAIAALEHG